MSVVMGQRGKTVAEKSPYKHLDPATVLILSFLFFEHATLVESIPCLMAASFASFWDFLCSKLTRQVSSATSLQKHPRPRLLLPSLQACFHPRSPDQGLHQPQAAACKSARFHHKIKTGSRQDGHTNCRMRTHFVPGILWPAGSPFFVLSDGCFAKCFGEMKIELAWEPWQNLCVKAVAYLPVIAISSVVEWCVTIMVHCLPFDRFVVNKL